MKKFFITICCLMVMSGVQMSTSQVFANDQNTNEVAIVTTPSAEEVPVIKGVSKAPREEGQIGSTKRQVHGGVLTILVVISGFAMVYLNRRPESRS